MDQPYAQPQFVMMPVQQRNALGVFAFFIALVGLFVPTGAISLLGLVLALAAIGRSPRGFATFGVILGLLGTLFWAGFMLVAIVIALVGALAATVFMAGAFMLTQPEVIEVTSDMVNVAIAVQEYEQENDSMPIELGALTLSASVAMDPWGATYRLETLDEEPGFDLVSGGPDGMFDTDDDVRLSGLDRMWETAFASFDARMNELGERLERMDHFAYEYDCSNWSATACPSKTERLAEARVLEAPAIESYEEKARRQVAAERALETVPAATTVDP